VSDESGIDWEEIADSAVEANIETGDKTPADGITTADEKTIGMDRRLKD